VYDLALLVRQFPPDADEQAKILRVLRSKSHAHGVVCGRDSLAAPRVKELAKSEWHTLALELETLPDFDECYALVQGFYEGLPW
jgi:hypothetical protein